LKPILSDNEKRVLELLMSDGRMSCTDIGKRIRLTPQAVGKIQEKLEKKRIITGYSARVDYQTLGVEVLAIAFFKFKSGSWTKLEENDIRERLSGPHLMKVYRVVEGDLTHMIIYGFRSMRELDNYFHILQTERGHISELKKLYILSTDSILKDSSDELVTKVLHEQGTERLARPEIPKPIPGLR
jgi:DNA-binding Lrp family transcriptional regulator